MDTTRCLLALVLTLSSTSHAVGGRPTSTAATHHANTLPKQSDQVAGRHMDFSLRMRRLAAAAPKPDIEYSPTWTLPGIDPMQMARDLGHSLADATNSLGSQLVTKLTGQSAAVATADLQTSQPNNNTTANTNTNANTDINTNTSINSLGTQTPKPKQAASDTAAASAQPEQTSRQLYDSQVDQLADMVAAVFMVHSASQLDVFDHLNTSHAITAAELAVDLFWKQVEGYVNGTFNLVRDLPEELAALPKNVSDAAASQQDHMAQAGNSTYLMESFNKLVHDLEEPLGISGGGSVFSYNPCFVNMAPAGISLSATGVNIGAPLVGISPAGISINPQGLNIQPTLISVSPVGVNVSPQGLNIAPALIAVSPGRVSINPQGGNIGGSLISVSAAASP
ncbi:hypothetical protein CVIRNUC_007085 [Coccomyxa viridis]|uniref:Uncharacterized protein n=1 Tax=Coccomyxa viridis TaxID=1274662 RepID=A0AAV1IC88_9CHLO|nr:hypothetical protein CVIRNUC_007085 [Coccomyxa viridis]